MNPPLQKSADLHPATSVQDRFGQAVGEVGRTWRHKLDQRLKPLGLSQSKWRALLYMSRMPAGISQTELARMLSIEAPTVTRLVKQLEEEGWVRRRTSPDDARCKAVHLTSRAKKVVVQIDAAVTQLRAETVGRLSEKQAEAGLAAIAAFQRFLDNV